MSDAEPVKSTASQPTAPGGYPADEKEQAEMKEKYEQTMRVVEKKRAELQSLRKQKRQAHHHKTLKSEYAKYVSKKQASDAEQKSAPPAPAGGTDDANNNANNAQTQPQPPKDLRKLHCNLTESRKLSGHGNKVYSCDWNPINPNHIVSVGRDGKMIFWNVDSGLKRLAYPLDTEFIMTLKYSPDGKHVACGGLDDILSIYPVRDETGLIQEVEPAVYSAHTGYISSLQYIDTHRILTASGDATIREWDLVKNTINSSHNTPKSTYRIHREDVMSIHLNPQHPELLLTGSVDSTAKIIDLREPARDYADNESSNAMQSASSSSQIGLLDSDKYVKYSYYMGYDSDLTSKKNRTTDVNVVKWFPDGSTFVTGCDDGTVRLFDMRSGGILNEYSYHKHYLNGDVEDSVHDNDANRNENDSVVRTSTNTQNGANGGGAGDDLDDDVKDDQPLKPSDEDPDYFEDEEDPTDGVATLDFSKSGAFMFVSYNNDQHKVLAWNVLTGQVVDELTHSGHVPCLAVSPDGKLLVTACWDHCLKIWRPNPRRTN